MCCSGEVNEKYHPGGENTDDEVPAPAPQAGTATGAAGAATAAVAAALEPAPAPACCAAAATVPARTSSAVGGGDKEAGSAGSCTVGEEEGRDTKSILSLQ